MSNFVSIRVYDVSFSEATYALPFHSVEFVYESGWFKDFVKRNIVSTEGTCDSRARDGKLVIRPNNHYDFKYCLEDLLVDPETKAFKISKMVRLQDIKDPAIHQEALKKKRVPEYVEVPYGGTVYDVIRLAKENYVFNQYSSEDNFVYDCVKIIKDKIRNLPKDVEPGNE